MKFSAQEEYGIRCLQNIGNAWKKNKTVTITDISSSEGISQHNTAKLLRILRIAGIIESERGQSGGYSLTRPPEEIYIKDVLAVLGGRLFDDSFCETHSGVSDICNHTLNCSVRSLWTVIQDAVDFVVANITLMDLLGPNKEMKDKLESNYATLEFVKENSGGMQGKNV